MATKFTHYYLFFGLAVVLSLVPQRQTVAQKGSAPTIKRTVTQSLRQPSALSFESEAAMRQAVFDTAARFVGMTERTNNNDATWIAIINRAANLPSRAHYCASAYNYVHSLNGIRLPVGDGVGMVRAYFSDASKIIYRRNGRGNQRVGPRPRRMDAVSLYASHIEGIAQDDFDPEEDDRVKLIGFNTTGGKGTRGGCYINYRRTSDIKLIANWLGPYWRKLHPNE